VSPRKRPPDAYMVIFEYAIRTTKLRTT
jgi:hypothetical protein